MGRERRTEATRCGEVQGREEDAGGKGSEKEAGDARPEEDSEDGILIPKNRRTWRVEAR